MPKQEDFVEKFWSEIPTSKILMLGLTNVEDSHTRPMTIQLDSDRRDAMWFFTTRENSLVKNVDLTERAFATFTSRNEYLFASIHGDLRLEVDSYVVERLWNSEIERWYPGGKTDPNLALLRFDLLRAEIWLNDSGILAGLKILFGTDPKEVFQESVAAVRFPKVATAAE
jgi:general stress protein 26